MATSFAQVVQTLLAGKALAWDKFRDHKAGSITLAKPEQRRLFAFLLAQDSAKVAQGNEELFAGLIAAWADEKTDPATQDAAPSGDGSLEVWRLVRIEGSGFRGPTVLGGQHLQFWIVGDKL